MSEIVSIFISFGLAVAGGFIAGYAMRKIIKVALVIVGGFIFVMIALQGVGWVEADYQKMTNDTVTFVSNTNIVPQLNSFINNFNIVILAGLTMGTIVGFVKGG